MNDRLRHALALRRNDRVPFMPAVYEHKAWFIGRTPSDVCRDEALLVASVLAEYEALRPDAMVVGIDVYNVEAEAAGCKVTYHEGPSIPALTPGMEALVQDNFRMPDPLKDGRMPVMLRATARVREEIGGEVPVFGSLCGPFSLAAALMGPADLLMAMASPEDAAREVIEKAVVIIMRYGRAYAAQGLGVAMFDSTATPDLISPRRYREFVLDPTRRVIAELIRSGMNEVPLIIGGNTDPILDDYIATGGNFLLCDGPASTQKFLAACMPARRAFRRNIPSDFLATASPEEIRRRTQAEVAEAQGYPGFIMGTGVIPYGTASEKILAVREALEGGE